jgi:hypothetical protein
MLHIYEQASLVIALLGDPKDTTEDVIYATEFDVTQRKADVSDLSRLYRGLDWLCSATWFSRIWVQQEVFASGRIPFLVGSHEFEQSPFLSEPQTLRNWLSPQVEQLSKTQGRTSKRRRLDGRSMPTDSQLSRLLERGGRNLHAYRVFSAARSVDMVEALLHSAGTEASDPLDHVYAVLGMSNFPAKPISFAGWAVREDRETFIPIDYQCELMSLYCTLSRALLFKLGLGLLARFQMVSNNDPTVELPSWVINWCSVSRYWSEAKTDESRMAGLANPWHFDARETPWGGLSLFDRSRRPMQDQRQVQSRIG